MKGKRRKKEFRPVRLDQLSRYLPTRYRRKYAATMREMARRPHRRDVTVGLPTAAVLVPDSTSPELV